MQEQDFGGLSVVSASKTGRRRSTWVAVMGLVILVLGGWMWWWRGKMASKPVAEVPAVTLVDNGVKVILTSEMTEVAVGDEVAVMIRGDSKGYALTAVDVKLAYDPDKFEFVELKNTDAAGNPGVLPDQLGPGVELKPGLTRLVLGSGIGNEIPAGADLVLGTLVLRVKSVEGDLAVRVLEDSIAAVKELRSNTLDRELGRVEFGKKG